MEGYGPSLGFASPFSLKLVYRARSRGREKRGCNRFTKSPRSYILDLVLRTALFTLAWMSHSAPFSDPIKAQELLVEYPLNRFHPHSRY